MVNLKKSKTNEKQNKKGLKECLQKCKIRDANTDEYAFSLLEREYIFNGYFLIALLGIGFVIGVFSILFFMCLFG